MLKFIENLLRPEVIVEFDHVNGKLPLYATEGAAGADIYGNETVTIPARGKVIITTGMRLKLPHKHYLRIESRSGWSAKFSIEKGAGIIDEDYEGIVNVILYNHSDDELVIAAGERIAQGILQKYVKARFVSGVIKRKSKRGEGGLGSTGTK